MVGDQFLNKGRTKEFCLWDGVKKGDKSMDKTFHDLDHGSGFGHIRIQDIVGIQDYTEIDDENKQMIIYIYPDEKMPAYNTWKTFIDMCQNNNKTPNVSIEAMVTQEQMTAKDIPVENLDYKQYDINDDDLIWVETGYRFVGAATVYMGACDDSDGCGILSSIDTDSPDGENMVNNETVILEANTNCDCNTATMIVENNNIPDLNLKINVDTSEIDVAIDKIKTLEEKQMTEKQPEVDLRLQEIETLKSKLVTCGEVRQQTEVEIAELKTKIQLLEKEKQELQEKLNKPITTIEEPQKNETVRDRGIKALEHLTGKKFKY
jgi:hypothetical protein